MVVDDNDMDLYVAKRVINRYAFAEDVIIMESANEALEYLNKNISDPNLLPDIIFLDINMPEMNGFEFLDAYTHLPETIKKKCIILMLTTSVHDEDKQKADENPYIKNYLNKPLDENKLKTLIEMFKNIEI